MQLAWKPGNSIITIDFDEETTVEQGIRLLLTKKKLPEEAVENGMIALAMWYGAKLLDNTSKLAAVVPTSGLPSVELKPRSKVVAPKGKMVEQLRLMLETTIQQSPREFLVISIGSYIHGDKGEEETMRQQCPVDILEYCKQKKLPLRIILADEGFMLGTNGGNQVYDYKTLVWIEQPDGQVVHYQCEKPPIHVYGFPTNLAEWGKQTETLAGTDLHGLAKALENSGGLLLVRSYTGDIMFRSPQCPELGK
jgi:hypothetical protein